MLEEILLLFFIFHPKPCLEKYKKDFSIMCHDLLPINIERDFFHQQKQLITLNYDGFRS